MNALTEIELKLMIAGGCSTPGCQHENHGKLYFHGRCHVHADCEVSYESGVIHTACAECRTPIADIKVAKE